MVDPASAASPTDAPAVVLVHGIQSCRREASVLLAAGMLHKAGFSVFLMDLRDHGDSEGDDAGFAGGSEEYLDVLGGWDWVHAQGVPESRIGLLGLSFGSITTLLAGGEDARVAAVWADSAPPRIDEAIGLFIADQLHDSTGLSRALVPGALIWARLIAGDDLDEAQPHRRGRQVRRAPRRVRARRRRRGPAGIVRNRAPRPGSGRGGRSRRTHGSYPMRATRRGCTSDAPGTSSGSSRSSRSLGTP